MSTLKDKVIFITGGNRGIGKSLIQASLKRDPKKIYATSRVLSNLPNFDDDRVVPLELDITNRDQILEIAEKANDVQVLFNNAGSVNQGTILEAEMSSIENDIRTNFYGTVNMMRVFAPILEQNAPSKIINIVSIVAYSPLPSIAGYSASKAALFSATLSARIELAKKGIKVQMVNPGAIDTEMNKGNNWDMPSPDEIAEIILDKAQKGVLDIVPDQMGLGMYKDWVKDPFLLAERFSDLYHGQ